MPGTRGPDASRFLLDGFWWNGGPPSGRMIVRALITEWAAKYPGDDLHVVLPEPEIATTKLPEGVTGHGTRAKPHGIAAALAMGRIARRISADALYTQNFAPVTFRPSAVFVHDAIFRTSPEWFTRRERLYFRPMAPLARRANRVLTSSHTEAARVEREFGLDCVVPVGMGISEAMLAGPSVQPRTVPDGPFLISVGRLNVRKNLERLLVAATRTDAVRPEAPLLVVGEPDGVATALSDDVRRKVETGAIRLLGHVPDPELKWLYEHANALAFPSLDEGFGLPPVEAAVLGCRAIVSDLPVFRETLDGAAPIFVDPYDVSAIKDALELALNSSREGGGLERYRWSNVVERTRAEMLEIAR